MAKLIDTGCWETKTPTGEKISLFRRGDVQTTVWDMLTTGEEVLKEYSVRYNALSGMSICSYEYKERPIDDAPSCVTIVLKESLDAEMAGPWLDQMAAGCTVSQAVVRIIAENQNIPEEEVTSRSNIVSDLELNSLTLVETILALEETFGIKIPLDQWVKEVNDGVTSQNKYFVVKGLCMRIEELMR